MKTILKKSLPITDVYPTYLPNGEIVYTDQKGSVGEAPPANTNADQKDVVVHLNDGSVVSVVNGIVTVTLPNGHTTQQPLDDKKSLGDAATVGKSMVSIGGTVATIGAAIPPPADAVVVAVGAIIAAIGALIGLFSNSAKTRALNAEAAAYEAANAELQSQNSQLDDKITVLKQNINKMKTALGITTPGYGTTSINGLGFCLINCAKDAAQARLDTAKRLYDSLQSQQSDKIKILNDMAVFSQNLLQKEHTRTIIYVGLAVGFVFIGALLYQKKFGKK